LKISLINAKVKFSNNQIISISSQDIEFLIESSLINKKHKKYLLLINYRAYQITCPIIENKDGEITVVIPAFKVPNSNIPIFVHLYAVALYITSSKSMRKTATDVKKLFGLETFSHTTIGRTLKKMIAKFDNNPEDFKTESCNNKKNEKITLTPRKHWRVEYIEKITKLRNFLSPILNKSRNEIIQIGTKISYNFFHKNKKYCF